MDSPSDHVSSHSDRPPPSSAAQQSDRSRQGRPALRLLVLIILAIGAANLLSAAVTATGLPLSREATLVISAAMIAGWLFAVLYLFSVGPLVLQLRESDRKRADLHKELLQNEQVRIKELAQRSAEVAASKASFEAEASARQHAEEQVRQLTQEMEHRVQERTAQFEAANRQLQTEVAAQIRTIESLRESEAHQRQLAEQTGQRLQQQASLLDFAGDALALCDANMRILSWNQGAAHIYGWTAQEVLNRNWFEVLADKSSPSPKDDALKALQQHGQWQAEVRQAAKGGQSLILDLRCRMIPPGQRQPALVLVAATDLRRRKLREAQFLRDDRLESTSALASGLAQELNNVLTTVLLSAEMLRSNLHEKEDEDLIAAIESSAQRSAELLRQTLIFARGIDGERVAVEPSRLLADIAEIAREIFPRNIQVISEIQQGVWKIRGDPAQLRHILIKLAVQARGAMPDGGILRLKASNRQLDERSVNLRPGLKQGSYVAVEIEDTGPPLAAATQEKLFEPFGGGNDARTGDGLGLAVILGMVKSHGGTIDAHSESGAGTTFEILLPAITESPTEATAQAEGALRGRGELILLVEEEIALQEVTRAALAKHGYEVLASSDGLEALGLLYQHQGKVRLVLTTMTAPSMDGPALARAVRQVNPQIRIIASSSLGRSLGQANKLVALQSVGINRVLSKPYSASELVAAVRDELAATQSSAR